MGMPTTVLVPADLLDSVDLRAKELGMSRDRFVIRALERAIHEEVEWSEDFVKALAAATRDNESASVVDEMRGAISSGLRSKRPTQL